MIEEALEIDSLPAIACGLADGRRRAYRNYRRIDLLSMARDENRQRTTLAGRRQFLVYVDPALVKDVKRLALERDESASAVVEEAIREYLQRKGGGKGRSQSRR